MTDQQQKSASTTAKTEQDPNMAIVEEKIIDTETLYTVFERC